MDEYDVKDVVYDAVEAANTGLPIYLDRSKDGEKGNHIVINALPWNENDDFINQGYVNVNIFTMQNANGMIDEQTEKTAVRAIKPQIKMIGVVGGQYRNAEIIWSESLGETKEGFDCKNLKILIKTDK